MQSKKILYVIGSLDLGGAERHLSLISRRMKQFGWEPTIYCISHRGIQSDELERNGVRVIGPPWEFSARQRIGRRFIQLFASCLRLLRLMIVDRPKIAHFFLPLAYVIGAPLAQLCRIPILIMSRRSLNVYQEQHPVLARVERILHKRMDIILCNSQAVSDQLVGSEDCDPRKVKLIYNGIDIDGIDRAPCSDDVSIRDAPLLLIMVANLIPYKGHSDLIDALAAVRDKMPEGWLLACVGRNDGIRSELEAQVRRLDLTEHIKFLGERTDAESLLKNADIGILCSHQEGFANAILEGMAAGLPMVVTDVGGNSESVVHGETGLIVPPRNPRSLGAAIARLASDEGERTKMGLAARKRAEEHFAVDRCVAQYDAEYRSLINNAATEGAVKKTPGLFFAARRSKLIRFSMLALVTALTLGVALSFADTNTILMAAKNLSIGTIVSVAAILLIGAALACVRFWYMASDIGYAMTPRDAMLGLSIGQIAGALTIQFFGQIAARSILLGRKDLSTSANIVLATYERLVAAMVSAAFAITGAWYLFKRIALNLELGGVDFLRIVLGLIVAMVGAAVFGWGKELLRAIPGSRQKMFISLGRAALLTAAIQICTMVAYVVAARSILPDIQLSNLAASAAVIAFAASLPISFAGWGVRELSAVVVLGFIGIQSGTALTISIFLGALALITLFIIAGVAMLMPGNNNIHIATSEEPSTDIDVISPVQKGIPIIAASAVFFQLHVPVGNTLLNVNLADPIVILGCAVFLIYFVFSGAARWRLSWFNTHIVVATVVIIGAFLHGYYVFGWNDWAFNNKLLGWFVLLSYGATGALIVSNDTKNLVLLLRTFVGTAVGVVVLELLFLLVDASFLNLPPGFYVLPLEGFSQNRNAFAFILLLAVCSTFAMPSRSRAAILGVLICGLWYAGSRAGWGVLLVILSVAAMQRILRIQTIAWATVVALAIMTVVATMPYVAYALSTLSANLMTNIGGALPNIGSELPSHFAVWNILLSPASSDVVRFTSILDGAKLFLSNPIFGAGLGTYVATAGNATPVVIHSTPVWLLGELGLVGFLAFVVPAVRIFSNEWRQSHRDIAAKLLILILLEFGIMSSIHEMLYQRAMWLLLGAAMAYIPHYIKRRTAEHAADTSADELREANLNRL